EKGELTQQSAGDGQNRPPDFAHHLTFWRVGWGIEYSGTDAAHRMMPMWLIAYHAARVKPLGYSPDTAPQRNAEPQRKGGTSAEKNPSQSLPMRSHAHRKVMVPQAIQTDDQH